MHFEHLYRMMPFGSRVVIQSITPDPALAKVRFWPVPDIEDNFVPLDDLRHMWPGLKFPSLLDVDQLEIRSQIHDTISLIHIPELKGDRTWVLKTVADAKYLYHELKLLLTLDPNPGILERPYYLVVGRGGSSGVTRVLGFILPYYTQGNLARAIKSRRSQGTLDTGTQLAWAKSLVNTLAWVTRSPAKYYSELKPDNILINDQGLPMLIDFEQSGNWESFTAPKIYHVENAKRLSESRFVPEEARVKYAQVYREHIPAHKTHGRTYTNSPEAGYFDAWNVLTSDRREVAMVYSLGKVIWCIFEGWSHTRNGLDEDYVEECGWAFPEFRSSNCKVVDLIRDCTRGSPDFISGPRHNIIRVGTKFYPQGQTGQNGEPEATSMESMRYAKELWSQRLSEMHQYLEAKLRVEAGQGSREDNELVGFSLRPSLKQVLQRLEALEQDHCLGFRFGGSPSPR